jgi:hypothetical protein
MNLIHILGYELTDDNKVKPILRERLKKGLGLIQQFPNSKIIVSGGHPPNKPQETEAKEMREWLIKKNVDPDRIIKEDRSVSTIEQILYLYRHLQKNSYDQIYIVGTEGGFDERIELITNFILTNETGIKVEGATLPDNISEQEKYQFIEGEKARITTLTRLMKDFQGDRIKALEELTQKHREGDIELLNEIDYELSTNKIKTN